MTGKQRRFVAEFLVDLNAAAAARRAGFSTRTAAEQGYRLLQHPDVAAAIAKGQAERAGRVRITADAVVAELAKLGFSNVMDYMRIGTDGDPIVDLSRLTRDQAAAIVEVTIDDFLDARRGNAREVRRIRLKLADKRAALVDLGRHLGMFKDKVEITADREEIAAEARRKLEEALARLASAEKDELS